jgi:hypothetical protein
VIKLLCYTQIRGRYLYNGELWVAIIAGSPGQGGVGIIIYGSAASLKYPTGEVIDKELVPGDRFEFSANLSYEESGQLAGPVRREVWGLDSNHVPPAVAGAWMKYKHLGRLE